MIIDDSLQLPSVILQSFGPSTRKLAPASIRACVTSTYTRLYAGGSASRTPPIHYSCPTDGYSIRGFNNKGRNISTIHQRFPFVQLLYIRDLISLRDLFLRRSLPIF